MARQLARYVERSFRRDSAPERPQCANSSCGRLWAVAAIHQTDLNGCRRDIARLGSDGTVQRPRQGKVGLHADNARLLLKANEVAGLLR